MAIKFADIAEFHNQMFIHEAMKMLREENPFHFLPVAMLRIQSKARKDL